MSTVLSPVDGSPMRKLMRYGIEIDVCEKTGGVWLDKGELEKILGLVREDYEHEGRPSRHSRRASDDDAFDYEDEDDPPKTRGRGNRNKRSRLLDIFDF